MCKCKHLPHSGVPLGYAFHKSTNWCPVQPRGVPNMYTKGILFLWLFFCAGIWGRIRMLRRKQNLSAEPRIIHFYRPQRSWGKVIFSQASVILLTGGCLLPGGLLWGGVCSRGGLVPGEVVCSGGVPDGDPPKDGHCCGRYASYWNAFLFRLYVLQTFRTS